MGRPVLAILPEEFRANQGKVGGQFEGAPLLLLTTTGAKSGQARTHPVMYLPDGDRLRRALTRLEVLMVADITTSATQISPKPIHRPTGMGS